jgi:hypothetical protein
VAFLCALSSFVLPASHWPAPFLENGSVLRIFSRPFPRFSHVPRPRASRPLATPTLDHMKMTMRRHC